MEKYGLEAKTVPIESLRPHPRNAREGDVEAIAASLRAFGQFRPIVVSADNYILAGNHTWMGALSLGWESISCVTVPFEHDSQTAVQIMLADNRTAEMGGYDDGLLLDLLGSLEDLSATGYEADDLTALRASLSEPPEGDPDDVPEPRSRDHISKEGDVWLLGDHRLIVGDSLDVDVLNRLFGDKSADLLVTDPPYGVNYVGKTKDALTIENDWSSGLHEFLTEAFANVLTHLRAGASFYWFTPTGINHLDHRLAARDAGLQVRSSIVWVKDRFVLGRSDYHARHETILYGWVDGKHLFNGGRTTDDVWEYSRPARNETHPTMKPVELIERAIELSSIPGDIVTDIFGGSGTTLIAAHRTNRICYMVEQELAYADVICRRFQQHTGLIPVLEATGERVSFIDELASDERAG